MGLGCPHRAHLVQMSDAHKLTFPISDFKMGGSGLVGLGCPHQAHLGQTSDTNSPMLAVSDIKMGEKCTSAVSGRQTSDPSGLGVGSPSP